MNNPTTVQNPPPRKEDWNHSEQVLVFYPSSPDSGLSEKWGIAYYHHNPPFNGPVWIDFANPNRTPIKWWPLPDPRMEPITQYTERIWQNNEVS